MNNDAISVVIAGIVVYQILVSNRVVCANQYTLMQRLAQLAIIWIVPIFGALVCHNFLSADTTQPKKRETAFTADDGNNPPGIGED